MPVQVPDRHWFEFGSFRLDGSARVLLRAGEVVALAPKIVDTLVVLVENAGKTLDKDTLIRAVWPDTFVEENNLTHNISVLRKTLGNDLGGRPYIQTLPKRGYRFVGQVKEAEPPEAAFEGDRGAWLT